ncbi:MAG: hypothetical protein CM1200mP14_02290 [Gammaproteobacteria bacterium]|nr:MAG: hypothetical protein CM1200mP14_02290 [Gammaproteobacteria bacterium]
MFEFGEGVVTCQREIEGGIEVVEADLPAVLTLPKGEYEPRYASLKGIMAAKRKPLEEREAEFSQRVFILNGSASLPLANPVVF